MKKILLLSVIIFATFILNAQSPAFQWAKQMGGTSSEVARSVASDSSGNIYTIGDFYGTVDFDPGTGTYNLTSTGYSDIFISKLDNLGNFIWAKQFAGSLSGYGYSISIDDFGNVYSSGTFNGSVDFDPGIGTCILTGGGLVDLFISKLDSSGNFVWAKKMEGGVYYCQASSIVNDKNGNIYYSGAFQNSVDFDPGLGSFYLNSVSGSVDIIVSKLDSSGNFIWAKQMGGSGEENGSSVIVDSLGNVYTTGYFNGTVDFNPGAGIFNLTSSGLQDIFISKLDSLGNFIWAKKMGGTNRDFGMSITFDNSGAVYTTGSFIGTVDFDPSLGTSNLTSAGGEDIFVSKLDAVGNFIWAKKMGGASSDRGESISLDANNNVYTVGYYNLTADFDPSAGVYNLTAVDSSDVFISKLDNSGNFVWTKSFGGVANDCGNALTIDPSSNVYTVGYFGSSVDFDPGAGIYNLASMGVFDVFVQKLSQTPLGILENSQHQNFISVFPNPTTNRLTIETTKPTTISIVNLLGEELINSKIEKTETIDVSFLLNGIYFVRDLNYGGSMKFVKQ